MPTLLSLLASPLLMLGCTVNSPLGPDTPAVPATWQYGSPAVSAPVTTASPALDASTNAANASIAETATLSRDWWRHFGSAQLDALIAQARKDSYDIAAASARVRQARAAARVADATKVPTVSGFADVGRQGGLLVGNDDSAGTSLDLGVVASYELDFWGAQHAQRDAARARARAATFDRDTVALTLSADVAAAWLQTMSLRDRTALARRNLATAQEILVLVASQVGAGSQTPLALAQQRGLVATQQRTVASLNSQANDSAVTLAILLGLPPSQLHLATVPLDTLQVPAIDAGVPASLLTHRPDLAEAEAQLQAAHADVTVARAAMLPNITLSASTGVGSDRFRTLFSSPLYSVASGLTAAIFNGGALAANRDATVARQEELLNVYRQAIIAAFGDVERALNALDGINAQAVAQNEAVVQAQHALTLADSRYRSGAELMLTVLTAQQTLYSAQDDAAQLDLARLQAAVTLYRALGGGWKSGPDTASQ